MLPRSASSVTHNSWFVQQRRQPGPLLVRQITRVHDPTLCLRHDNAKAATSHTQAVACSGRLILSSESLDTNPAVRCRELLAAANTLVGNLLKQDRLPAAAVLGAKGGTQTAKRGSEYFRQLAAKRKLARAVDPAKTLDSCRIKSLIKTEAWRDGRDS